MTSNRRPQGAPASTGGQYAPTTRKEPVLDLDNPPPLDHVLKPNMIYMGHQTFHCAKSSCAGSSALHTGVDINGYQLTPIIKEDVEEWETYGLGPLRCECGQLTAAVRQGRLVILGGS